MEFTSSTLVSKFRLTWWHSKVSEVSWPQSVSTQSSLPIDWSSLQAMAKPASTSERSRLIFRVVSGMIGYQPRVSSTIMTSRVPMMVAKMLIPRMMTPIRAFFEFGMTSSFIQLRLNRIFCHKKTLLSIPLPPVQLTESIPSRILSPL
jgi:hypothetical protein